MEVKIPFGPASVYVQYGTSDEVAHMNSDHIRSYKRHKVDDALEQLAEESGVNHEFKIRVEYDDKTNKSQRRAIANVLVDTINECNPPLGLSFPFDHNALTQDMFHFNNIHLLDREECYDKGEKAVGVIMRARQRWFESEAGQSEEIKDRASVAKVLAALTPSLSAADRLAAENIIVDKLGPAKHKAGRADKDKRAGALAFMLDDTQRSADRLTTLLGGVGIDGELAEQIKKKVGEAIYR